MSELSKDQIKKLALLSRLELAEEEIEQYLVELNSILAYVERLNEVDTTGLKPSYQVSGLDTVMREDIVLSQPASPDNLMALSPRTKDGYIQVGRMI